MRIITIMKPHSKAWFLVWILTNQHSAIVTPGRDMGCLLHCEEKTPCYDGAALYARVIVYHSFLWNPPGTLETTLIVN